MSVTELDAAAYAVGIPASFSISAGSSRIFYLLAFKGDGVSTTPYTSMTWGDQAMTLEAEAHSAGSDVSSQIWSLKESAIVAKTGDGIVGLGSAGSSTSSVVLSVQDAVQGAETTNEQFSNGTSGTLSLVRAADSFTIAAVYHDSTNATTMGNPADSITQTIGNGRVSFGTQADTSNTSNVTWSNAFSRDNTTVGLNVGTAASGPVLSLPTETSITDTTVTVGATTDDATGTLYYYISTSATAPSVANLKSVSGSVKFGNDASLSVGANTFAVTGLTASTNYYTYFIQNDGANDSNLLESGIWATIAAPTPTIVSPSSGTNGTNIQSVVTEGGDITSSSLKTTVGGHSIALNITAQTSTTLNEDIESGANDATSGVPADGVPMESTIDAAGITAWQLEHEVTDGSTPNAINYTLNANTLYEVIQTTTAVANTTPGESIFGTDIITVEDDMQARVPKTDGGTTFTWAADGTVTADSGDEVVLDIPFFAPSTGQWSLLEYTIQAGSEVPAQFTFTDVTDADLSTVYTDTQALTGGTLVDGVSDLTVTNGLTSVTGSGGTFNSSVKTYSAGNSFVRATVTSSSSQDTAVTQTPDVNGISDTFSVTTLNILPTITGPTAPNAVELSALSLRYVITDREGEAPTLTGTDAALFTITNVGGDDYDVDKITNTGVATTVYNITPRIDNMVDDPVTLPVVITVVEASTGSGGNHLNIAIGIRI